MVVVGKVLQFRNFFSPLIWKCDYRKPRHVDVEESLFIYGFNYYVVISKSSQTRNSRYKRK